MSTQENIIVNELIKDLKSFNLKDGSTHSLEYLKSAYKTSVEFGSLELFNLMEEILTPSEIHSLNVLEYYTPFFQAIKYGHSEIVHKMYEHANFSAREVMLTLYDNHAYSVALQSGHFELADWIFERTHEFHIFEEN